MNEIERLTAEIAKLREEIAALRAERVVHHYHHQVPGQPLTYPSMPSYPSYPMYPGGPPPITCGISWNGVG